MNAAKCVWISFTGVLAMLANTSQAQERIFAPAIKELGAYSIDAEKIAENKDVSAIATAPSGYGFLASDETVCVQPCRVLPEQRAIEVNGGEVTLLRDAGSEMDLEALTILGDYCYAVGSHGAAKKSGKLQDARFALCRFLWNTANGEATGRVERFTLSLVIQADPVLSRYFERPLQQRGVNIEGCAVRNRKLFFGFRGPNVDGNAFVLELDPEALFGRAVLTVKRHELALGPGLGIRDMQAIRERGDYDGFLLLVGNAGSEPGDEDYPDTVTDIQDYVPNRGFGVYYWDGASYLEHIAALPPREDSPKAEALLVTQHDARELRFLVLYDGVAGGAPTEYGITCAAPAGEPQP